jgi:hypothetical protein
MTYSLPSEPLRASWIPGSKLSQGRTCATNELPAGLPGPVINKEHIVPHTPFEARQIVIAHESIWNELRAFARSRQLRIAPMPTARADDLPTYYFQYTS